MIYINYSFIKFIASLALSKIPLNAFSTLFACFVKPSLTTVSDQPRYSLSTIAFIFGLIAMALCNSISLPSVVGKSLFASATTSFFCL